VHALEHLLEHWIGLIPLGTGPPTYLPTYPYPQAAAAKRKMAKNGVLPVL